MTAARAGLADVPRFDVETPKRTHDASRRQRDEAPLHFVAAQRPEIAFDRRR